MLDVWRRELAISEDIDANAPECQELRRRVEQYADAGYGSCLLSDPRIAEMVQDNLLHFDGERYRLVAWCIMPNHVHVLVEVADGFTLSTILHSWRSYTAHKANKILCRTGEFWQSEYFDRFIRNTEHLCKTIEYIFGNPDKAGLVEWKWRGVLWDALSGEALSGGAGGSPAETVDSISYTYDALGHLSAVSSGSNVFTYSYLSGTDLVSGMAANTGYAWERTYEPDRDLVATVENSFGDAVVSRFDYTNDAIGRRTAIARSGAAFSSLSGSVDAYGYNGRSEVTSARRTLGGDEVRGFAFDYAYDPIGNRTSSAEYDENGIRRLSLYESNELNEYTRRTVAGHATVLGEADADAEVTVNGAPAWRKGPYFYGGANVFNATNAVFAELEVEAVRDLGNDTNAVDSAVVRRFVPETPERFAYDADGNMTSDGRWTYTWNGENRLVRAVEAVHPTNRAPRVVEYAYDHRGRMVWKTIGGTNAPPDTALAYVWDDYNIVRETKNEEVTHNIWGFDLDGTLQGCGGVGGLLAVVKDGEVYTPTYDANGNISEYLDSDGTIIAHQEYDPFGNAVVSSGDVGTFTHWFSTKPWCPVTGMVEYQYREYSPTLGRWTSRDLVFYDKNPYVACKNDQVRRLDLFGLISLKSQYNGTTDIKELIEFRDWFLKKTENISLPEKYADYETAIDNFRFWFDVNPNRENERKIDIDWFKRQSAVTKALKRLNSHYGNEKGTELGGQSGCEWAKSMLCDKELGAFVSFPTGIVWNAVVNPGPHDALYPAMGVLQLKGVSKELVARINEGNKITITGTVHVSFSDDYNWHKGKGVLIPLFLAGVNASQLGVSGHVPRVINITDDALVKLREAGYGKDYTMVGEFDMEVNIECHD